MLKHVTRKSLVGVSLMFINLLTGTTRFPKGGGKTTRRISKQNEDCIRTGLICPNFLFAFNTIPTKGL